MRCSTSSRPAQPAGSSPRRATSITSAASGTSANRPPATWPIANNPRCQADDKRIEKLRMRTALRWFPELPDKIGALMSRYPDADHGQDVPTPDVMFDDRLQLRAGDLDIELLHTPGGETIDCARRVAPRTSGGAGEQPVRTAVPPLPELQHPPCRPLPVPGALHGEHRPGASPRRRDAHHRPAHADRRCTS